jgi:hypothetical protein
VSGYKLGERPKRECGNILRMIHHEGHEEHREKKEKRD